MLDVLWVLLKSNISSMVFVEHMRVVVSLVDEKSIIFLERSAGALSGLTPFSAEAQPAPRRLSYEVVRCLDVAMR